MAKKILNEGYNPPPPPKQPNPVRGYTPPPPPKPRPTPPKKSK
jgi:hypothetical protein